MWFGREGRHGVCIVVNSCCVFQTMTANAYIFMSLFHKQLFNHDYEKSYKRVIIIYARIKKTIKKLVKHLKF